LCHFFLFRIVSSDIFGNWLTEAQIITFCLYTIDISENLFITHICIIEEKYFRIHPRSPFLTVSHGENKHIIISINSIKTYQD
jgi:hypothetical protein